MRSILLIVFLFLMNTSCGGEKLEVDLQNIVFEATCDPYLPILKSAISYVVAHQDRMPYHGDRAVAVLTGQGPKLTIACEETDSPEVKATYGLATYWPETRSAQIRINPETALKAQWYMTMLGVMDIDMDALAFFAAGILAHEATHVVDLHYLGSECSTEYNPDLNEYNVWNLGSVIDEVIACYDTKRRGCEAAENHSLEFVECLKVKIF